MRWWVPCLGLILGGSIGLSWAEEPAPAKTAAERGRETLLGRVFVPPNWSAKGYENVWKQWGVAEKPADYHRAVRERYGLHEAPFDNKGLPMGLRETRSLFGRGVAVDCLLCHGGSIAGRSYIGLGNATMDMQTLYDELAAADGLKRGTPFTFSNVRGTSEAGAMAVYLLQYRDADLNVRAPVALGYRTDLCEDVPAWWLLKKKETMYHTGSTPARSVRSIMQFMLTPLNSGEYIKSQEPAFADLQAFLLSVEPPKYPFPVDEDQAAQGKILFGQHCARCHGSYGPDGDYPNKIVPLEVIGTDRTRAEGFTLLSKDHYNQSWFGREKGKDGETYQGTYNLGYQAPPLDGVWATAPYFHNGSVPTVYHVLNSKARPKVFTRSYRTQAEDYDTNKLGWKITILHQGADPNLPALERRKVYDTSQPGRGNGGHTFGDELTEEERMAVIEYLKTL
jgi:mono/diheme cytochrome c family protein